MDESITAGVLNNRSTGDATAEGLSKYARDTDLMVVFDSTDVEYLIKNFSVSQLRREIQNARDKLRGETDEFMRIYWLDLIQACQTAIKYIESLNPVKKSDSAQPRISAEDVKDKIDIVDYIGQYVRLRKSGNRYQGLCPFHADRKSPSFIIYPEQQSFHCFGCQAHGTVIDFVMRYFNWGFKEALDHLSR